MSPISATLIIFSASCTVGTQMLLKGAGGAVSQMLEQTNLGVIYKAPLFILTQPLLLSAIALQGIGFLLWIIVLSRESAATALGLGGASVYLLTAFAEWAIYDIRLSFIKAIALILISVGAVLLSTLNS